MIVVSSALRYCFEAFRTQSVFSFVPPVTHDGLVHAIRLIPSTTRALYFPPPLGLFVSFAQLASRPAIPEVTVAFPVVMKILQKFLSVQGIEILLFAARARVISSPMLSSFFELQEMVKALKRNYIKNSVTKCSFLFKDFCCINLLSNVKFLALGFINRMPFFKKLVKYFRENPIFSMDILSYLLLHFSKM